MEDDRLFARGKPRYVTAGIHERLPIPYQMIVWEMVDAWADGSETDWLQVFRLSAKGMGGGLSMQKIEHSQEQPERSTVYHFPIMGDGIGGKIYVIDDGDHATMLWADEY